MNSPGTLKVTTPGDREIQMVRSFAAPRRRVFDALTRPELLKRWMYGPNGWSLAVCDIDLRKGGACRYVWRKDADGTEMGMSGVIREVVPPERPVATERFDEAWYPGEALASWTLAEKDGRTTLTLTLRYESKEARDVALTSAMDEGMSMGYDRLEELLSSPELGAGSGASRS